MKNTDQKIIDKTMIMFGEQFQKDKLDIKLDSVTAEKIARLMGQYSQPKPVVFDIKCKDCKKIVGKHIDPNTWGGGAFPASGETYCPRCYNIKKLKE